MLRNLNAAEEKLSDDGKAHRVCRFTAGAPGGAK